MGETLRQIVEFDRRIGKQLLQVAQFFAQAGILFVQQSVVGCQLVDLLFGKHFAVTNGHVFSLENVNFVVLLIDLLFQFDEPLGLLGGMGLQKGDFFLIAPDHYFTVGQFLA